MNEIKVLVTGGGAPGIKGTLYSLKNNWEKRRIKTICVDMDNNAVGRYLCDKFFRIPAGSDPEFIPTLLSICEKERVDVILPQVTAELLKLSENKKEFENVGVGIAVSQHKAIKTANNKMELLKISERIGVPTPRYFVVRKWDDLIKAAEKIGYPFVIKPPEGSGMRGFRVVYRNLNAKEDFFKNKPDSSKIGINNLYEVIGNEFPDLIVMEYLPGDEFTVDVLSLRDKVYVVIPRRRIKIRSGITFIGLTEKRDDIIRYVKKLTKNIGLEYAHGFQFKLDSNGIPKILESNPRIQGTMVLSTFARANVIYGAVKMSLDEELPELKPVWNVKLIRYWGAVGTWGNEVIIV